MSAAPVLPRPTWDDSPRSLWERLVETWRGLDVPEGWRAEIIEERIVVTPPPGNGHNLIADLVHRCLVQAISRDWAVFQTAGIVVPSRDSLFVPDLLVVPRQDVPGDDDPIPIPAEKTLLVAEITSKSNAETERGPKLWSYANAGVPLHLLIDRFAEGGPMVTLYWGPIEGVYTESHRVSFGKKLVIPEPFDLTLDTAEF